MKNITTQQLILKGFTKTGKNEWSYDGEETYVIDFYADWCEPCKKMDTILSNISSVYTDIKFFRVNVEDESELSEMFNITSLPTIIIASKNNESKTIDGAVSQNKLESMILNNTSRIKMAV